MAESDAAVAAAAALASETSQEAPSENPAEEVFVSDNKRKLEELSTATETVRDGPEEGEERGEKDSSVDVKRQKIDGDGDGEVRDDGEKERLGSDEVQVNSGVLLGKDGVAEVAPVVQSQMAVNGQNERIENLHDSFEQNLPKPTGEDVPNEDNNDAPSEHHTNASDTSSSRNIEVPNNKVGVLIGKSGEIIRSLQIISGAKIQITRDNEADPNSSSRPVEITGSVESINKAEQLIKDVIAEADAGGSPALVARGFTGVQSGAEQIEMQVPNEKVGLVIGKGGETIKSLQTRSGARIQLIPQHLPEGDTSTERTVRISGNKKQIEAAKFLVLAAINQTLRPAPRQDGYAQQGYGPQGSGPGSYWGPRPSPLGHPGHDYQKRGMYPQQSNQYPPQYGNYQQPPRGGPIWDQRPSVHGPHHGGGYDYYKHSGPAYDSHSGMATGPGPTNYNYGQQPSYQQAGPTPQAYGQGYGSHTQGQQYYGQQPMNTQPGYHSGYPQQAAHGQQSYGPPRGPQPDPVYQGPPPTQQTYPYGSAPPQPAPYGVPYGADGYAQSSAGYQQGGYAQGMQQQPAPVYSQPAAGQQGGGYQQYPAQQQGYGDPAAASINYGFQAAPADASGYASSHSAAGYTAPPAAGQTGYSQQPGYAQPAVNSTGYDQTAATAQAGYVSTQNVPVAAATPAASVPPAGY